MNKKRVQFFIDEDAFVKIEKQAIDKGFMSANDYIRSLALKSIGRSSDFSALFSQLLKGVEQREAGLFMIRDIVYPSPGVLGTKFLNRVERGKVKGVTFEGCDSSGIAIYKKIDVNDNVIYLNPGSIGRPRDYSIGTFSVITRNAITIFDLNLNEINEYKL